MLTTLRARAEDDCVYELALDVLIYPVDDGSARLIDLDGAFHALSRSAAELLRATLDHGVAGAVECIVERYDVDRAQVRADLDAMLINLAQEGLIETPTSFSRARRLRRRLAIALMSPLLGLTRRLFEVERSNMVVLILLARSSIALFGFGPSVAAWGRAIPPRDHSVLPSDEIMNHIDNAVRTSAMKLPSIGCKERALACWYASRVVNANTSLIIGLQLYPMGAHCWCRVGERFLSDDAPRCDGYVPIVRYEAGDDFMILSPAPDDLR